MTRRIAAHEKRHRPCVSAVAGQRGERRPYLNSI
jgi:hypothetical protein